MARQFDGPQTKENDVRFIYEDREIIVIDKPVGLPVIAPEGGRGRNALDLVSAHVRRRNPKGRAALVHRLDRDTSGVMVFATNARSKRVLMEAWQEMARERCYTALVEGALGSEQGRLSSWIAEAGPNRMRIAREGERGALEARGSWRLLAAGAGYNLIEVSLETGRKHQIRLQLASMGHPVAGDHVYGARSDPEGHLMLHASLLVLVHPESGDEMRFESPPPLGFRDALTRAVPWPQKPTRPAGFKHG
jgi:23S rRNA pseudouridine1911/1915/1917 synthase